MMSTRVRRDSLIGRGGTPTNGDSEDIVLIPPSIFYPPHSSLSLSSALVGT